MIRNRKAKARSSGRAALMRAVLVAGSAALLAGCVTEGSTDVASGGAYDYRLRHPIVVKEKAKVVHLFIGKDRSTLTPDQRAQVRGFAQTWRQEATGGIIIDVPRGAPNAAASAGASREARSLLIAAGVPPRVIAVHPYHVPNPHRLATVQLSYPRMAAEAGPCGEWPDDIGSNTIENVENKPYWNFGCATQRNLAAMVADPADLVQPRAETPADATRRAVVLGHYERGEPTAAKGNDNNAAKITDIGK